MTIVSIRAAVCHEAATKDGWRSADDAGRQKCANINMS